MIIKEFCKLILFLKNVDKIVYIELKFFINEFSKFVERYEIIMKQLVIKILIILEVEIIESLVNVVFILDFMVYVIVVFEIWVLEINGVFLQIVVRKEKQREVFEEVIIFLILRDNLLLIISMLFSIIQLLMIKLIRFLIEFIIIIMLMIFII